MRVVTKDNIHFIAANFADMVTQIRYSVQSPHQNNESFIQYIAAYWNASISHFELDGSSEEMFLESMRDHGLLYIEGNSNDVK